MENIKLNHK